MAGILALKIDVDTYQGMRLGVPRLLSLLRRQGIRASFFLSIGPDASGRALWQLFKNPMFLKKMVRSRAASLYGFRTALYGTLLPSPMIALSFPGLVRQMLTDGHEVQFHAWDHRRWQDDLPQRSETWIREWFQRGFEGFQALTGVRPTAFGAPAWRIDDRVLAEVRGHNLDYLSCTRAKSPFVHAGVDLVEIPSDLPCFEETGLEEGRRRILSDLSSGGIHVWPVHAEMEGGIGETAFAGLLQDAMGLGYEILTLREILHRLPVDRLVSRKFRMELLPGRAVPCAV